MTKLLMLSSREGSSDGLHVQWYLEGRTYDVSDSLAAIFLKEGWAKPVGCLAQLGHIFDLPQAEASTVEVAPAHKQEYSAKKHRK